MWIHGGLTLNKSMRFQASINADDNVNSNNRQGLAFFAADLLISKLLFLLSLNKQHFLPIECLNIKASLLSDVMNKF